MCSVLIDVGQHCIFHFIHYAGLAQAIGSWSKPLPNKKTNAAIGSF